MSEQRILLLSVFASTFFAVFGLVLGIISGSGMILFDAVYSAMNIGLTVLSMYIIKVVEAGQSPRFPYGKSLFETLFILFQSLALLGMCIYTLTQASIDLLGDGRYVTPEQGLFYAVICTLGCFFMAGFIKHLNRHRQSMLINLESKLWLGDAYLSTGVLAGFAVSYGLQETPWSHWIAYADPAMMAIASAAFILIPVKLAVRALKELLLHSVDKDDYQKIEYTLQTHLKSIPVHINMEDCSLKVVKTGREVSVDVCLLIEENTQLSIEHQDNLRLALKNVAKTIAEYQSITVSLTQEKQWL